MANGKQIYFTDLIGDSYKTWHDTKIVMDGGTGTGKTYFIISILGCYLKQTGKTMLYLCNRKELKKQVIKDAKDSGVNDVVYVSTYQAVQNKLRGEKKLPYYDYIVADECHYFTNDALFNEYTDLSYKYIQTQNDKVIIFMSATAKIFFHWLRKKDIVTEERYFSIPKTYDYVDNIFFYNKKLLIPKLDEILQTEEDSKIIVFCNSISRMIELYEKYGESAYYMAAESADKVQAFCTNNCIQKYENGTITFDKRILVTTKVLDNGVDIKDEKVKHIFSEILDVDSAIQALGRKRSLSKDDTCTFYLKDYSGQAIQGLINTNEYQIEPVLEYRKNYNNFLNQFGNNRQRIRNNRIFFSKFEQDKSKNHIAYNKMRLKKYMMDNNILHEMKEASYKSVMINLFGSELFGRISDLDMVAEEKDEFLEYLKSLEGQWLYPDERKNLGKQFEKIGLKMRYTGINTFNGALDDKYPNYKCRFRCKQLDENGNLTKKILVDSRRKLSNGSDNPNRNKTYWILE